MENINTNILKIILGKHKKNEELKEEKNKEKNEDKDEFIQNIIKTNKFDSSQKEAIIQAKKI